MTWNRLMLVLAGIAGAGMIAIACGGDDNSNKACQSDTDCSSGQICHPLAKFCVATCTDSSSCPDNEKNCNTLTLPDGSSTSQKICQCNADADCGGGTGSSNICGSEDKVCEVKCGSNADCNSGRTCDTATGQCKSAPSNTCNSSNTTIGSNGGPDVCNYGSFCASDNTCQTAQNGGCSQSTVSGASSWTGTDHAAPVITNVTAVGSATSNTSTQCADGGPMTIFTVDYYVPGGLTANTSFANWRLNVWSAIGTQSSFGNADFSGGEAPPPGQDFGELKFGACGYQSGSAAVFIQNDAGKTSNTVCLTY